MLFDVSVHYKIKDLSYSGFCILCMKERDDKKCSFIIATHEDCFIDCCIDFLKTSVKISGPEKLNPLLMSNCFYSAAGFDSDDDDDVFSCISANFGE